ncbi:MAG: type II toxin-antitoxin system HicB family antitoxin [Desulfuromonadaceae bacterium]|nr:type II toxin-antitoxin system HicB family antitoxin [Desulfuromonadaceae bacterium]MDD2856465.1 type II toxin-antitoxin system HicB family antitoxin [Desulfuromonadaceae bacterium]
MKQTLEHNGYYGSAEISVEDNCLFGKLLFINDLIMYSADTFEELKKEFQAAVDDYLETCRLVGKEAERPFKGSLNVRITPELHRKAALVATREDVSLNVIIAKAIEAYVYKQDQPVNVINNNHNYFNTDQSGLISTKHTETFEGNGESQWTISPRITSATH